MSKSLARTRANRAETPGGVWGGDTPPQSRESSPRRANDSKLSGQFLQIRKKLPPNHIITKSNTVLFVGQYKGHALFVGHCSYIPPPKVEPKFRPCVQNKDTVAQGKNGGIMA